MKRILVATLVLLIAAPAFARLGDEEAKQPNRNNPLRIISKMMDDVAGRLRKEDTALETQKREDKIIEGVDKLIEIAKKQQQQQQQQQKKKQQKKEQQKKQQNKPKNTDAQGKSKQPMQDERAVNAKTTEGRLRPNVGSAGMEWGNLPPRAREEFLQILKENFPENYKQLVRHYFKNLSEQP